VKSPTKTKGSEIARLQNIPKISKEYSQNGYNKPNKGPIKSYTIFNNNGSDYEREDFEILSTDKEYEEDNSIENGM